MANPFLRSVKIEGTFLSPVHVGWGRELDTFSCLIRDGRLYYLNLSAMIQRLRPETRMKFVGIMEKGRLPEVRTFIREHVDLSLDALGSMAVSANLAREYEAKMDDPKNQLIFQPFFRGNLSFNAILPGSSIKGAMRTAVIDAVLAESRLTLDGEALRNPRRMESAVLGHRSIDEDPFKALKVPDLNLGTESTAICSVYNYSPRRAKLTDLGLRFETVRSELEGKGVVFQASLDFFEGLRGAVVAGRGERRKALSRYIEPEYILAACRRFYSHNLREEHDRFYEKSPYGEASRKLVERADRLRPDECLLRVGRFTQAESKSINTYRKVMVRGRGGSRLMDFGTTRNLAHGRYPLGWMILRFSGVNPEKCEALRTGLPAPPSFSPDKGRKGERSASDGPATNLSRLRDKYRVK